jgi:chemotaxis-related protein WspD
MKPADDNSAIASSDASTLVDCWNRIGVMGDGSCAKLAEVVHCRNCHVFSTARALLLDRTPPPGYQREWTKHFSQAKPPVTPGNISVVIFRTGAEWLALSTRVFHEVAERRPMHSVPHRQTGIVLGLVNFRGELLICVSLAKLLGISDENPPQKLWKPDDRLMVVEWQGSFLAFPVDEIHGVHRYHPDELKDIPATLGKSASAFTHGILPWQSRMVGCLDEERLFTTLNRSLA